MILSYASDKLRAEFLDARLLQRNRGAVQAKKIGLRISTILAARHLGELRPPTPGRFHPLTADKAGWIACDLDGPYRLILEPDHSPLPTLPDGGLDWNQVTCVKILGVLDYHERNKSRPS